MLRDTKQNGRPEGIGTPDVENFLENYLAAGAMSMLVSFSVSPSTLPFTVTWCPECAATLSCASTTYTFLSASFTNTYFAPCSLTHLVVHSPWPSFAPFTPHWLSAIQPLQELSAAIASAPAKSVAAIAIVKRTFMVFPLEKSTAVFGPPGRQVACHSGGPVSRLFPRTLIRQICAPGCAQEKREDSLESSLYWQCTQGVGPCFRGICLLPGRRSARRGRSRRLRHAQVARRRRLGDFVDHQFERRAAAAGVEKDRLVDRPVLLLEALVVGQHVNRVLVLLGVGIAQLDLDGADFLRPGLALDSKLEIIALSHAAELIDFIVIPRDERAHFATGHLNAVLGGVEVGLHARNVAIQPVHIFGVRFRGKFRLYGCREVGHLFVHGPGRILVLLPRRE